MLEKDFHELIVNRLPLVDVRAPVEFAAGSIPGSVNLELLDDEQRHLVGTCYRERGREAAFDLGEQLVSGELRRERVRRWAEFLETTGHLCLYCARGGMRSQTAQRWLREYTGVLVPRLDGGYKAVRNYLLDHLEPDWLQSRPVILGGRTGAGKTELLRQLPNHIDLEGLANHRGSSFGRFTTPQPGQADFENHLAASLIRFEHEGFSHLILEDEGRHVGKRFLPRALSTHFNSGPLVILDTPAELRVQNTFREYVVESQQEYIRAFGEQNGFSRWFDGISDGIGRIAKRLGGQIYNEVVQQLEHARMVQQSRGEMEQHKEWIRSLLRHYYDPMYDYQIDLKHEKIVFCGNTEAVLDYLRSLG